MRRLIIHLFVALLTFAIGTAASALFLSPSPVSITRREVTVEKRTLTLQKSEPLSTSCGCNIGSSTGEFDATAAAPDQTREPISGGVLNGKALSLPKPTYPAIARAARASGTVVVEIVIDERGCIESARAVSGHPLLQNAGVEAARRACFTPTRLSGQPVKVSGVITYNFVVDN